MKLSALIPLVFVVGSVRGQGDLPTIDLTMSDNGRGQVEFRDRKSTRLNSSHLATLGGKHRSGPVQYGQRRGDTPAVRDDPIAGSCTYVLLPTNSTLHEPLDQLIDHRRVRRLAGILLDLHRQQPDGRSTRHEHARDADNAGAHR